MEAHVVVAHAIYNWFIDQFTYQADTKLKNGTIDENQKNSMIEDFT